MCTSLNQLMRIALLLTAIDAALVFFPVTAHAGSGYRRAIDAGVAAAKNVGRPRQYRQNKSKNDRFCGWGRKI